MSDLAALAFALIVICLVVFFTAKWYNQRHVSRAASHIARIPWQLEEHGDETDWLLWATRPHSTERRCLARVAWDDSDFEAKVEEARINADVKLHTLNRGLPK